MTSIRFFLFTIGDCQLLKNRKMPARSYLSPLILMTKAYFILTWRTNLLFWQDPWKNAWMLTNSHVSEKMIFMLGWTIFGLWDSNRDLYPNRRKVMLIRVELWQIIFCFVSYIRRYRTCGKHDQKPD